MYKLIAVNNKGLFITNNMDIKFLQGIAARLKFDRFSIILNGSEVYSQGRAI